MVLRSNLTSLKEYQCSQTRNAKYSRLSMALQTKEEIQENVQLNTVFSAKNSNLEWKAQRLSGIKNCQKRRTKKKAQKITWNPPNQRCGF